MGNCLILMKNYNKPRTETYAVTSKESAIDMGEYNNYRYINSSGVPNVNSATYTPTSRSSALDMGAANTYRYVNTNSVPVSISNLYTYSAQGNTAFSYTLTASYKYVIVIVSIGDGGGDSASIYVDASKSLTALFNKRLTTKDYDNYTRVYYFANGVSGDWIAMNGSWCRHASILGLN